MQGPTGSATVPGVTAAPRVAAFYVGHQGAVYHSRKHPVDLLLKDCEGLHTEMATGNTVTATTARQREQTSSSAAWRYAQELEREEQQANNGRKDDV